MNASCLALGGSMSTTGTAGGYCVRDRYKHIHVRLRCPDLRNMVSSPLSVIPASEPGSTNDVYF